MDRDPIVLFTPEEYKKNRREMRVACERAEEYVSSWPEWKRKIPVTAIPPNKR